MISDTIRPRDRTPPGRMALRRPDRAAPAADLDAAVRADPGRPGSSLDGARAPAVPLIRGALSAGVLRPQPGGDPQLVRLLPARGRPPLPLLAGGGEGAALGVRDPAASLGPLCAAGGPAPVRVPRL